MGARPDAGIFVAAPIDQIVPALGARPRVVGNFVGRQAGLGAGRLREVVEIARGVVVGNDELAGFLQTEKRRVLLDGQLIERKMLGRLGNGALELGRPGGRRLARPRIDEIERVALEIRARHRDRVERFLRAVQAAQLFQRGIVECLHAERHAVDAGGAIAAEARCFHAGRIGFQRHLDVGRDAPVFADGIENGLHRRRLHQRRRAAAEEDRRNGAAGHARGGRGDLGFERAHETRLVDTAMAHVAVEVAIGALRQAERPVHIDGNG